MIKGGAAVYTARLVLDLHVNPVKLAGQGIIMPTLHMKRLRLTKASGDLSKLAEMDSNPRFSNSGSGTFSATLLPAHMFRA